MRWRKASNKIIMKVFPNKKKYLFSVLKYFYTAEDI